MVHVRREPCFAPLTKSQLLSSALAFGITTSANLVLPSLATYNVVPGIDLESGSSAR